MSCEILSIGTPVVLRQTGPVLAEELALIKEWGADRIGSLTTREGEYADNLKPNAAAFEAMLTHPTMNRINRLMHVTADIAAKAMFGDRVEAVHSCSWFNKADPGQAFSRHQELGFDEDISVVMHLTDGGGLLRIFTPLPEKVGGLAQQVSWHTDIAPIQGQILAFPGYLWHEVLPHGGADARYSVASRWKVSPFEVPSHLPSLTQPSPR